MEQIRKAGLKEDKTTGCYQFKIFARYRAVAAFSGRRWRMNFLPDRLNSVVAASRRHFCKLMAIPFDRLVCLEQVHGGHIKRVEAKDAGSGARNAEGALRGADGSLTAEKEIALAVRSADCAPLFFLDPKKRVIGMAHVGWRGATERLPAKMVQAFRHQYLSRPADLIVGIGPMIKPCCYEVGPEFKEYFGAFAVKKGKGYAFDLFGWIVENLKSEGVRPERIYDSGLCTACRNDLLPSFRKEGKKVSHMLSVLSLN